MYKNLTLIKNKLIKSRATIFTPREPLSFDKSEILDIRITTAASGKGEKAIRRLKYVIFHCQKDKFMVSKIFQVEQLFP